MGLTARYALNPAVSLAAGYGATAIGGANGYRANGTGGDLIGSDWRATMLWAGAFWKPHRAFHVGGGPAWYKMENLFETPTISQPAVMGEAGIELPADRRLFLSLAGRLYLIRSEDVDHGTTVVIPLRPKWTHWAVLAGLGVRL